MCDVRTSIQGLRVTREDCGAKYLQCAPVLRRTVAYCTLFWQFLPACYKPQQVQVFGCKIANCEKIFKTRFLGKIFEMFISKTLKDLHGVSWVLTELFH